MTEVLEFQVEAVKHHKQSKIPLHNTYIFGISNVIASPWHMHLTTDKFQFKLPFTT